MAVIKEARKKEEVVGVRGFRMSKKPHRAKHPHPKEKHHGAKRPVYGPWYVCSVVILQCSHDTPYHPPPPPPLF